MVDIPATTEAEELLRKSYDASDPAQVKAMRKKAARDRREEMDVWQVLMSQPRVRKVLWDLMETACVHGNPVVHGDTHATYFNLGQRNMGLYVLQQVQVFPELYLQMVKESKQEPDQF